MARWEFKLPDIGEGIAEGEIVAWLVRPGDAVTEDQPIVEVMTDKATVTITAPKAGVVVDTRGRVGEIVAVHGVLVVFELDASAGVQPARDAIKLAFYRTVTTAIKPLRASLAMRRVLRRIALGKRANYYLKGA